jgi:hypothetical protein
MEGYQGAILAIEQPAPVGDMPQQGPDRLSQRPGQMRTDQYITKKGSLGVGSALEP